MVAYIAGHYLVRARKHPKRFSLSAFLSFLLPRIYSLLHFTLISENNFVIWCVCMCAKNNPPSLYDTCPGIPLLVPRFQPMLFS